MSSETPKKLANIKIHPAVIVFGALIIGLVGDEVWLLDPRWGPPAIFQSLGIGLIAVGLLMLIFSYGAMARARTTIDPRRHTTRIVSTGIYRISRNPIYLGWFIVILGAGLENLSLFRILVSLLMIGLLHWAVVLREEKYLEHAFGDEYMQYKQSVRRWL